MARVLHQARVGTLLFDLLTRDEEAEDAVDAHLRFDIGLLAPHVRRFSECNMIRGIWKKNRHLPCSF